MASHSPQNQQRLVLAALVLVAIAFVPIHCDQSQNSAASLKQSNDGQQASSGNGRQGRAIGGQGASANQLLSSHHGTSSNIIEHNSSKSHLEAEKRQVQDFLTTKNIFKSIIKLLFGNQDEISATSRNVLGVLTKVLDLLKNTFGQRSRSGTARTIRDSAEDAASAGVSMLQGYVKSVLATDDKCVQKYLCQASKEATRDSRDLGYVIASVGGYASSYLLDNSKSANFKSLYDASMKGRSANEDCARLYADCTEHIETMDPNNVLPEQLADENYIERLFPKCSPKYTNEHSQYKSSNTTSNQSRRQNRAKVHQHSRKELEARRNKRRNMNSDDSVSTNSSLKATAGLNNVNQTESGNRFATTSRTSTTNNSIASNNETTKNKMSSNRVSAAANHRSALRAISSDSTDDEQGTFTLIRKSKSMSLAAHKSQLQVTKDTPQQSNSSKLTTSGKRRPGKYAASQNLLQQLQRSQSGGFQSNEQNITSQTQNSSMQENTRLNRTNNERQSKNHPKEQTSNSNSADTNILVEVERSNNNNNNGEQDQRHPRSTFGSGRILIDQQVDCESKSTIDPIIMPAEVSKDRVSDSSELNSAQTQVSQSTSSMSGQIDSQIGSSNFYNDKNNSIENIGSNSIRGTSSTVKPLKNDSTSLTTSSTRLNTDGLVEVERQRSSSLNGDNGRSGSGSCLTNTPTMCLTTDASQKDDGKYINLFVYDNNTPATTKIERKVRDSHSTVSTQTQPDIDGSSTTGTVTTTAATATTTTPTLPVNISTSSSKEANERQRQTFSRSISQDNVVDSYPNLISTKRHHPSHRLLTADLNEDEHDRISGKIVSNDASTEELCGNEDLVESVDLRKKISLASNVPLRDRRGQNQNSLEQVPPASNSSSPTASNMSTPTMSPKRRFSADVTCPPVPLSSSPRQQSHPPPLHRDTHPHPHPHPHHHRSSLTGITTLQTVDEKAEINNEETETNDSRESKVKREGFVSRSIDDIRVTTDEFSSDSNSNGRNNQPEPYSTPSGNHIRKPPGFPQRIKHQPQKSDVASGNVPVVLADGSPKQSDDSNGSDITSTVAISSGTRSKQDTQPESQSSSQFQRRLSLPKAERQVRFELPSSSKQSDNKLDSQVDPKQKSLSDSGNQQQYADQSIGSSLEDSTATTISRSTTNNNVRHIRSEQPAMQRETNQSFEQESNVLQSNHATKDDDYVDITDKNLSAAINKVSLMTSQADRGETMMQHLTDLTSGSVGETTTSDLAALPNAKSNLGDEFTVAQSMGHQMPSSTSSEQTIKQQPQIGPETQVTTARYHKLPNESSHYSIIRSSTYQTMSNTVASTNMINTKSPAMNNPAPPRSASLQFNNLSDADSGSDNERVPVAPSSNHHHHQQQGVANNSKVYSEIVSTQPVEAAKSNDLDDSSVVSRINNHQNNSFLPSNSNGSNNNTVNLNDDDQTPTTKTALIFPRLDEGLSSEAESADEGGSDGDDEQAMEADVDADDDEDDEDDDDDDDMDDELDTNPMSVMDRETHSTTVQMALDCYVRGNNNQQQSQKPISRTLSALQQQQQQHQQSQQTIMVSMANQNEHNSDLQQQQQQVVTRSQCSTYNCVNQNSMDQSDMKSATSFSNQNGGGQTNYWMAVPNQQSSLSVQTNQSHVYGNQRQQNNNPSATGNNMPSQFKANTSSFNRDEALKVPSRLSSDTDNETDRLLGSQRSEQMNKMSGGVNLSNSTDIQPISSFKQQGSSSREVLIEGVLFNVKYLGSTHTDCEGRGEKEDRIHQAEMAVHEVKIRNGDAQSAIDVQLFISTEKIMVLDDKHRKIMMDHSLRTISYIADIGDAIVLIVRKKSTNVDATNELGRSMSRISCHVFESNESHTITKSISQAFQVAYTELLKANGAGDAVNYLPKELDYQEVLNSQEMSTDELEMFARKENQHEVIVPKKKGEILGVSIVESGWGSVLPTVVIASIKQDGPAYRCKKLSVGDQILSINGISLVGLPLAECQEILRKTRKQTVARLSVVPCPITVEVKIKRPDTKYQLGFSVQNGVICSLLRGGIAERGGVRVGHRIMSINGTTVVGVPHEKIVTLLASSVGEIRMKTCLTSLYRLILGEENPVHF